MKSIETNKISEKSIDELMDRIRSTTSRMLIEYLQICKKYDKLKTIYKEEKLKNSFTPGCFNFYEEIGKTSWELIHNNLLLQSEKYIQKEYSMLNVNEARLCCLLFFEVPLPYIVKILPYSQNSVYSTRLKIRRKTGVEDMQEIYIKIFLNVI